MIDADELRKAQSAAAAERKAQGFSTAGPDEPAADVPKRKSRRKNKAKAPVEQVADLNEEYALILADNRAIVLKEEMGADGRTMPRFLSVRPETLRVG